MSSALHKCWTSRVKWSGIFWLFTYENSLMDGGRLAKVTELRTRNDIPQYVKPMIIRQTTNSSRRWSLSWGKLAVFELFNWGYFWADALFSFLKGEATLCWVLSSHCEALGQLTAMQYSHQVKQITGTRAGSNKWFDSGVKELALQHLRKTRRQRCQTHLCGKGILQSRGCHRILSFPRLLPLRVMELPRPIPNPRRRWYYRYLAPEDVDSSEGVRGRQWPNLDHILRESLFSLFRVWLLFGSKQAWCHDICGIVKGHL